jgi:hypothetical protein
MTEKFTKCKTVYTYANFVKVYIQLPTDARHKAKKKNQDKTSDMIN